MKILWIIALCSMFALPALARSTTYGRTANVVNQLATACAVFQLEYRVYPPEQTWLNELLAASNATINTRRIIFIEMVGSNDAWGNPFVYRMPGKHNPDSFDLYSLGKDGRTKTGGNDPDDIGSWHSRGRLSRHYDPLVRMPVRIAAAVGIAAVVLIIMVMRRRLFKTIGF